jgi:uncharacterized protein YyaL (SSP411 family)
MMGRVTNRLAESLSPYLLAHADNPVDWWPWGAAAFAEARRRDVPVFLSVGYAACHWCHVMAHESFEDEGIAEQLNAGFVSIKVDREERPDVDDTYMAATTALTGRGGWPMSVWLDHEARPFYAGTYFPPTPRPGLPSFGEVLGAISEAWGQRRGELTDAATRIATALSPPSPAAGRRARLTGAGLGCGLGSGVGSAGAGGGGQGGGEGRHVTWPQWSAEAVAGLARDFDQAGGGFGSAPKFPPSMVLEFLLRHHENNRGSSTDGGALEMVRRTCAAMAVGGIYDQLGGGFARYSVDGEWQVPHFEKMLSDNALLLNVYTHLARLTGSESASRVARETAEFLLRDLRTPEGGFASALDADSSRPTDPQGPVVEGVYYVWTRAEIEAAVGPRDGEWAADLLGVTAAGSFDFGASTLTLREEPDDPERWRRVRLRLAEARAERPRPARDDKIVAGWNGLAVASLATAGVVFDEPGWIESARECATLLLTTHWSGGRLLRVSRAGRPGAAPGMLEDYANVLSALLVLHAATGEADWLTHAGEMVEGLLAEFTAHDGSAGWYDAPVDPEGLLGRRYTPTDNAYPSGGSAAAAALLTWSGLGFGAGGLTATGLRNLCEDQVLDQQGLMRRHPRFAGGWLAVLEAMIDGPVDVALIGPAADGRTRDLIAAAFRAAPPGVVIARGSGAEVRVPAPLLAGRSQVAGVPAAYVCRDSVCRRPVTAAEDLIELLAE